MSDRTVASLLQGHAALESYIHARGLRTIALFAASAPTEESFTATITRDFLDGWHDHHHDPDEDGDPMLVTARLRAAWQDACAITIAQRSAPAPTAALSAAPDPPGLRLHRLRRLQRLWAYLGHYLQLSPGNLRLRLHAHP